MSKIYIAHATQLLGRKELGNGSYSNRKHY